MLRLDPRLAPVKVAVLPLSRNEALSPKARDLAAELRRYWNVDFDDAQAIGRRYRRQDEIGTPFCVTVDFDTLDDGAVTVRERDTMSQERISRQGHATTWRRASSDAEPVTHLRAGSGASSRRPTIRPRKLGLPPDPPRSALDVRTPPLTAILAP